MNSLIPLVKKGNSKDIDDNFLIEVESKIYLMDNHRLALWCWFQKLKLTEKYNFIHIDAHPDLSESALTFYNREKNPIENMSLDEYRSIIQPDINIPLFRWDNYIQVLTKIYPELLNSNYTYSFTHKLGSQKTLSIDLAPIFLLKELEEIFSQKRYVNQSNWVVNLDLDYFYTSQPHKLMMFDKAYIEKIGEYLRLGLDSNLISVLTIAFSPECCGSWEKAEEAFAILNKTLKIKTGDLF